jgi:hypothetical protein
MHPASQFGSKTTALAAVLLLIGTAGAQQAGPAAPAAIPQIHKMTIYNGLVPTVSYSVQGGSPHLEALSQTLQFTENEMTLTQELQRLRLGIVANEQTLDMIRTSQALGFGPISTPGYAAWDARPDSRLKRALIPGLAQEATPAMAFELINLREQVQTELQAELAKAAAAVRGDPPAKQNAPAVAPRQDRPSRRRKHRPQNHRPPRRRLLLGFLHKQSRSSSRCRWIQPRFSRWCAKIRRRYVSGLCKRNSRFCKSTRRSCKCTSSKSYVCSGSTAWILR